MRRDLGLLEEVPFEEYVRLMIDVPKEDMEPVCPFHGLDWGGECNNAYTNKCYKCHIAEKDYIAEGWHWTELQYISEGRAWDI